MSPNLMQWGAPATMLGGALVVIANLMSPFVVNFDNLSGSTATNTYIFQHFC